MNGKIIEITSDVIRVKFPKGKVPGIGIIIKTDSGAVLSLERIISDTEALAIILSAKKPLTVNEKIKSTKKPLQAPVGKKSLGRIFNVLGEPIDGKPLGKGIKFEDVQIFKNVHKGFVQKDKKLITGVKAIDFFVPILEGDKIGMFGGAGVGKTLIIKELINNVSLKTKKKYNAIFTGIGERSREGEELYRELTEDKMIDKVQLFFAQMNEMPGARMKVIYSALTAAEYFRDKEKSDTLMFIDNIYRFTQAGAELSSSLGNIPSQSGYQPTLMTEISNVQERLSNSANGSITSFQTVFVPADDITDPATVNIFSHLDSSLVLDREIASAGRYPAISPLQSSSNNLTADIVGERHAKLVMEVKRHLQRYEEVADLLAILGSSGLNKEDLEIVNRARKLENYFTQNMFSAQEFTQKKGAWVPLEETLDITEDIMAGKYDEYPAQLFLYLDSAEALKTRINIIKNKKPVEKLVLTKKELKMQAKAKKKGKK